MNGKAIANNAHGRAIMAGIGSGRGSDPEAATPGSISCERQSHTGKACRSQNSTGMAALSLYVVEAHPLPALAKRVAVHQSKPRAGGGGFGEGALEVFRLETGVAVNIALAVTRRDQLMNKCCQTAP